jgi:antitoxin component of RelBE/YafQ-DinJ toxin-antitoxin module
MSLYNLMLSQEIKKDLRDFSAGFNLKMSDVVRMAITEFIENHKNDVVNENGEFVKGANA